MAELRSLRPSGGISPADKAEREHWQAVSESLKDLTRHPGWDIYVKILEDLEKNAIQSLITGQASEHDRRAGYIDGLRVAYHLPTSIDNRQ